MTTQLRSGILAALLFGWVALGCSHAGQRDEAANGSKTVALQAAIPASFTFVAYGDTRFHDPSDAKPANVEARQALVAAIDREHPAFVSIGGDIVYTGEDAADWGVWDHETAVWREHNIAVYPALGNHDVKGDLVKALGNYFARFPQLQQARFYSVSTANCLMLILDSNMDELSGAQGEWLRSQLAQIPASVDFVFFVFHHPVYTSSSDDKSMGGGHSARAGEQALGSFLEERQAHARARFVVFNGHVHNYERFQHGGVTYFVTGGGGARPYGIRHKPEDAYQDGGVNFHYLLVHVDQKQLTVIMNKLERKDGKESWTQPDKISITAPSTIPARAD